MNLRNEITSYISRAIDSSSNYSGKEYEENRHAWEQITTDRIVHSILRHLPEGIDVRSKYELTEDGGLSVALDDEDEASINYLCSWAEDQGYNKYRLELLNYFDSLYKTEMDGVSLEHEQRIYGTSESSRSPDKEQKQGEEGVSA